MTMRQDKFIQNLKTAKTPTQAARDAGYKNPSVQASRIMNDEQLAKKIAEYGVIGLDTLRDVAINSKMDMARASAGKTLVETSLGKPKDNKQSFLGDVTINVLKIEQPPLNS